MTGVLLLVLLLGLVVLSLWAVVDASLQPDQAYTVAGLRKGVVTTLLVLTCAVGGAVYALVLRPRLMRARRGRRDG